jgi:hypothetical protein
MPQFTIKLHTYDPVIVEVFKRLRKSRKQTAFTHEALKYFLASEKGVQVMELMEGGPTQSQSMPHDPAHNDLSKDSAPAGRMVTPSASIGLPRDYLKDVMDNILK